MLQGLRGSDYKHPVNRLTESSFLQDPDMEKKVYNKVF